MYTATNCCPPEDSITIGLLQGVTPNQDDGVLYNGSYYVIDNVGFGSPVQLYTSVLTDVCSISICPSNTPTPTPSMTVTPSITHTSTPTPTPTPGCPSCQTYTISADTSNNCGEYFTYTDCLTENTIFVGLNTNVNAWLTPPFGSNPLTICSCDPPDLTFVSGCTYTLDGPIGPCDVEVCNCYDVFISETDNPTTNPIYLNVRQCGGAYETLVFTTQNINYKYCFAEVFDLYQMVGGIPTALSGSSNITGPFGACSTVGDCG